MVKLKNKKRLKKFFNKFDNRKEINISKGSILIYDISSVFKSHICANPAVTSNGIPMGGTIGTINSIIRLSRQYNAKEIICVFDGKNNAKKRQKIYDQYKVDRGKKNDNVRSPLIQNLYKAKENKDLQQRLLVALLKRMPVKIINIKGLEADDIISYLVNTYYSDKDRQRIIVSEDKDMLQLINENTHLYKHRKKDIIRREDLKKEGFGQFPENIVYYRIVEGDKSDNVDGIRGIGHKTMAKLIPELESNIINTFDDFYSLLETKEESLIKTKKGKSLLKSKELLYRNYRLMNLSNSNEMITPTEEQSILELMSIDAFKESNIIGLRKIIKEFRIGDELPEGKFRKFFNKIKYL